MATLIAIENVEKRRGIYALSFSETRVKKRDFEKFILWMHYSQNANLKSGSQLDETDQLVYLQGVQVHDLVVGQVRVSIELQQKEEQRRMFISRVGGKIGRRQAFFKG